MSIDAMKACPACGTPRGTKKVGWTPILRQGLLSGYTCPDCPTDVEPITRETLANGNVRFNAVVVHRPDKGQRLQRRRRFNNLADARSWVEETRAGLKKATDYTDPASLTFKATADRWIAHRRLEVEAGGLREVSLFGYESSLSGPLLHMGDRLLREISTDDVEAVLRKLATTGGTRGRALSRRSVAYSLGTLRQVFAFAKRQKWITENPATDAKLPGTKAKKADDGRVRRWTPQQLKAFRATVDNYADGAAFTAEPWLHVGMLLTLSGLRRSEVLGLDWAAVDMDTGAVEVRQGRVKTGRKNDTALDAPKTENSARVVQVEQIHPGFTKALKALWLKQGRPSSGLVISDKLGEIHPDRYSRRFVALCDEAGVPRLTRVHNVRHSIAVGLQAAGVPDVQGAAMLGHDTLTYSRFYVVGDAEAASEAATATGQLFAV